MKNEHVSGEDHTWACKQIHGELGEISNFTMLSAPQVETITGDPTKIEEICPGGTVVCNTCETPFPKTLAQETTPPIDFKALSRDLVKPASVKAT